MIASATRRADRLPRRALVALACAMNLLVLWNAVRHDPHVGYDAGPHIKYSRFLAQGELPRPRDNREFFAPPLPYVVPALARLAGVESEHRVGRVMQLANVAFSVAITLLLLRICERLRPGDARLALLALGILALLPVYYKSFSQARPEPLVTALGLWMVYEAISVLAFGDHGGWRLLRLSLAVGLLPLSRQWGALLLPAVAFMGIGLWIRRHYGLAFLVKLGAALLVSVSVASGWFYWHLHTSYGSVTAFNRAPESSFSLANQPLDYYFGTGNGRLFSRPIRPAFANQLFPILHSEIWGDYWCYFLVWGRAADGGYRAGRYLERAIRPPGPADGFTTNAGRIVPYLGRINAVSLPASLLLAAGLLAGVARIGRVLARGRADPRTVASALVAAAVVCTLLGFQWVLISHPDLEQGDNIKATYILQAFPLLALLAGELLLAVRSRSTVLYRAACALLVATAVHNLPALVTRYTAPW